MENNNKKAKKNKKRSSENPTTKNPNNNNNNNNKTKNNNDQKTNNNNDTKNNDKKNNNNKTKNNNDKKNSKNNNNNNSASKKTTNLKKSSKTKFGIFCQGLFWCGASVAFVYALIPFIFWYFPEMCTFMIFSNRFRWPPLGQLTKPSEHGLNHTRNFYVNPRRNIQIGVWHVLPQNLADSNLGYSEYEQSLSEHKSPVVLYMHGNTGTRAGWHRIEMYKLFSALNYHTITFDYRGYAESTGVPSEDGVVEDAQFLFSWIKQRVSSDTPVILWGHSLGTGVATQLAKNLCNQGTCPTTLVLEAPFTNIVNATYHHPFLIPFNIFKDLKLKLTSFVRRSGVEFASDESISSVTCPIMILHAEDDFLIPIALGKKLYDVGVETRPKDSGPIKFVPFKAVHGYGHKHIHKAPELPGILSSFVQTCVEKGF